MWTRRKYLLLFVLLFLFSSVALSAEVSLSDEAYNKLVQNLAQLKLELKSIKTIPIRSQQDLQRVKKILEKKESEIQNISKVLADYKTNLQTRNSDIEKLLTELDQLKKDLEELQEKLTVHQGLLTDAYQSLENQQTLSVILGTTSGILLIIAILMYFFG